MAPTVLPFNSAMTLISLFTLTAAFYGGAWSLWQAFLPAALALWGGLNWRWNNTAFLPRSIKFGIVLPVALVLTLPLFQMLPLLGLTHPFYALVNPSLWPAVSLNIPVTLSYWLYGLSLALATCGTYALTRRNLADITLPRGFAFAIMAVAVYGLVIYAAGNHSVVWLAKRAYASNLTATFINPHHFAALAGIGILTCLALFLERAGEISSRLSLRQSLSAIWLLMFQPRWPWLAGAGVLGVALVLSGSHLGQYATLAAVSMMLLSIAVARKAMRVPVAAVFGAGALAALAVIGLTGLPSAPTSSFNHPVVESLTRQAIAEYPITGQGLGTFEDLFSLQRTSVQALGVPGTIDHAHNTWLELSAELGLPAAVLLALALFTALAFLLQGLTLRRRGVSWPALGIALMCLMALHTTLGFALSMPAVTMAFLLLLAYCMAQSFPEADPTQPVPPRSWAGRTLPALAVLVVPFSLWLSYAEFPAARADKTLRQLENGTSPTLIAHQLAKARAHLQNSVNRNPWQSTAFYNLARAETALAQAKTGASSAVMQAEARHHYTRALQLQPSLSGAWYRLAWLENARNNTPAAQGMLANSLLTGGYEPQFLLARTPLLLTLYPHAQPENQTLYAATLRNLWSWRPSAVWQIIGTSPTLAEQMRRILAANQTRFESSWKTVTGTPLYQHISDPAATQPPTPEAEIIPQAGPVPKAKPKARQVARKRHAR